MPERYQVSNRKDEAQQKKSAKTSAPKTSSIPKLSPAAWVGVGVAVVVLTNLATFVITSAVYQGKVKTLETQVKQLQDQASGKTTTVSKDTNQTSPSASTTVPAATRNNVQTAISNNTLNSLKESLGSSTSVTLAGSSTTQLNPQQVIDSLSKYTSGATGGWNFNIPADTLNQLQHGSNAQYFGSNAIIAISGNGYVISVVVDPNGQITSIFVSPSLQDAIGTITQTGKENSE